jgi:hypothetical protein
VERADLRDQYNIGSEKQAQNSTVQDDEEKKLQT